MKHFSFLLFLLIILGLSCKKEPGNPLLEKKMVMLNVLDTSILVSDTLYYSFGYFGDEEGISLISEAADSGSCKLMNRQWEERIMQYIPGKNFTGVDSISVVTGKGSDGASLSSENDTFLIIIRVLKDEFHRKLVGRWCLTSSCGGFTGGCWYPPNENYEMIEFDNSMWYVLQQNNQIISRLKYQLNGSFAGISVTIYKIRLESTHNTYCYFSGDTLNIQGGDFWKAYKRSR
jgi:hypothetical protein